MADIPKNIVTTLLQESGNTFKLYAYVLEQCEKASADRVQISQDKMGIDCCLSPATVIRSLKRLRQLGIIHVFKQRRPNRPSYYQLVHLTQSSRDSIRSKASTEVVSNQSYQFTIEDYKAAKKVQPIGTCLHHMKGN